MKAIDKKAIGIGFVALLVVGLNSSLAQTPDYVWAKQLTGTAAIQSNAVAIDASGNTYVTGLFAGTSSFGSVSLPSSGGADVFIAKFNPAGDVIWAKSAGGSGSDSGVELVLDAQGNCYVTGGFSGNATFGAITLSTTSNTASFIAKYSSSGDLVWCNKADGAAVQDIALGPDGELLITGNFHGEAQFGATVLTTAEIADLFIAKFDSAGNAVWATKVAGIVPPTGLTTTSGAGIAVDPTGHTLVCGYYQYDSPMIGTFSDSELFIARLTPAGAVAWIMLPSTGAGFEMAHDVAADNQGNFYVTGQFDNSLILGSDTLLANEGRIFTAKFDANSNALWARNARGSIARDITLGSDGSAYITGTFNGDLSFGSQTVSSGNSLNTDLFVAKYNSQGNAQWIVASGGSIYLEIGNDVAVGPTGEVILTGRFGGTSTFGNFTLTTTQAGAFLAKLSTITGLPESATFSIPTFPNPFTTSFQISLPTLEPATAIFTDLLGREVYRQYLTPETENEQITISPSQILPSGLYILQIQQGKEIRQARVLKQ